MKKYYIIPAVGPGVLLLNKFGACLGHFGSESTARRWWRRNVAVLSAAVILAASAQAGEITVAKDAAAVANCAALGQVQSNPPYWTLNAALRQVKRHAELLHGDTVLIVNSNLWFTTAMAYRCGS